MKEALTKLSNELSAQEIVDEFESIASNYADEKTLETHFKNNKAFYNYDPESRKKKENTPVVENQKELNINQLETNVLVEKENLIFEFPKLNIAVQSLFIEIEHPKLNVTFKSINETLYTVDCDSNSNSWQFNLTNK
jgi:hypothetical protein